MLKISDFYTVSERQQSEILAVVAALSSRYTSVVNGMPEVGDNTSTSCSA